MASARKETERTKFIQDKCQTLLTQMLRDEDNKYCVDCDAKGPRWASWNLGVFLCIRCAGIHRNLGVHISRVRSVNLDTWSPEQVVSLQNMGNSRARAVYEAQLPDGFRRPQTDSALETFIRAKYEHKKYMAREWVPQPPAVANWDREIDEEMEQQKRSKKKSAGGSSSGFGLGASNISESGVARKAVNPATSAPVVLAKPAPSPKSSRTTAAAAATAAASAAAQKAATPSLASSDLLGLSLPTTAANGSSAKTTASSSSSNADDLFSNFLSAPPAAAAATVPTAASQSNIVPASNGKTSLAEQEADFFNQVAPTEQEKGKMTRDSILALYGQAPTGQFHNGAIGGGGSGGGAPFGQFSMAPPQQQQHQQQQQQQQQMNAAFGGLAAFGNAQLLGGQTTQTASPFGGLTSAPPAQQQPNNMFAAFGNSGLGAFGSVAQQPQQPSFAQFPPMAASTTSAMPFGNGVGSNSSVFGPATTNGNAASAAALNQKLNSLNLGNVWQ